MIVNQCKVISLILRNIKNNILLYTLILYVIISKIYKF
jgi:hypothetical protein